MKELRQTMNGSEGVFKIIEWKESYERLMKPIERAKEAYERAMKDLVRAMQTLWNRLWETMR